MRKAFTCLWIFTVALTGCNDDGEKTRNDNTLSVTDVQLIQSKESETHANVNEDGEQQIVQKKTWGISDAEKQKYSTEQQELLEKHLKLMNNPELIAAEAKRRKNIRIAARKKMLAVLEGNGLSYQLGKGHLVINSQDFHSIAEERCLTVDDVLKSNPWLKSSNNRFQAPFSGLVLNLPDHACSDPISPSNRDEPIKSTK